MIDIDNMTIKELRDLQALAKSIFGAASPQPDTVERFDEKPVIVRSYGAGLFFGYIVWKVQNEVECVRCRRIWNWKGANTASEIALNGVIAQGSRVAEATPRHRILDVIEIIDAQPSCVKALEAAKWQP